MEWSQFHDGWFEGFRIDGETIHLYLSTVRRMRFTIVACGVAAFQASGFREGNIILDVTVRKSAEIQVADLVLMLDGEPSSEELEQQGRRLDEIRREGLKFLEISSSYGGECVALARSFELVSR